ncbi:rab3 GTPase-activating protein non-catalytic subunit-like [Ornithodoros turicata]|uniref:rab3 GTPase-activating protein non-catalytic subunit-like n=1 Tax=Ornithodoros turicata TaxID=34597 RepID=UPI003139C91C
MSCQLIRICYIGDVQSVKRTLFPQENDNEGAVSSNQVHDSWDWPVGEEPQENSTHEKKKQESNKWLQECITSMSPAADVMALGRKQNAVFLTAKAGIGEDDSSKYEMSYHGCLREDTGDEITALLCLPLSSQKRSYQGSPDWTCIIVGFKSGNIQIYTDDGRPLLTQLLHEEPVLNLKCRTYEPPRFSGFSEQPDELYVIYPQAVVCVEGFGLFQTLRACRNQLARAAAGNWNSVTPPPLSYKKWGQQDIKDVQDCELAGTSLPTLFDQMALESIRKSQGRTFRTSVSASSLLMAAGSDPYLGFYYAKEGSIQPLLSDVAMAVALRLKSFISENFLGMRKNAADENKAAPIEPATQVPLRFGVYDRHRHGSAIYMSPNKNHVAVTDSVGRIILFDVFKGVATRIWKGYRDAECGWIEVDDTTPETRVNGVPRRVQFLIIYAQRWGILEIWCPHQSSRVAAFDVGKTGRLLFNNYTLIGLNNVLARTVRTNTYPCCFLTPDGKLYTIVVPFHRVLSERNRARDFQLLNEIQEFLKRGSSDQEQMIEKMTNVFLDMKAPNMQLQGLERVASSPDVSPKVLKSVTDVLENRLKEQEEEQLSYDSRVLLQSCTRLSQLRHLYEAIQQERKNDTSVQDGSISSALVPEVLASELKLPTDVVFKLLSRVIFYKPLWLSHQRKVTFKDEAMTLDKFLGHFELFKSNLEKEGAGPLPIATKSGINTHVLGRYLFSAAIETDKNHSSIQDVIARTGITPAVLAESLVQYWLSEELTLGQWSYWLAFHRLLKFISLLEGDEASFTAASPTSMWWQSIRNMLAASPNVLASCVGVAIGQSVSSSFLKRPQEGEAAEAHLKEPGKSLSGSGDRDDPVIIGDEGEEEQGWEPVVIEFDHWETLLKKLKDVLALSTLLKCAVEENKTPARKEISLSFLLASGQGVVTELVAAWACDIGLSPEGVALLTKLEVDPIKTIEPSSHGVVKQEELNFLFWKLRRRFTRSLETDSLLANCAWEHLVRWDKDRSKVCHLSRAIDFLSDVSSVILKNGVGCIMWKTFVQKRFEALALLMEKVGKTPKDRLCRRDVEISDIHLEEFVNFCRRLLETIMEAAVGPEVEALPVLPLDPLWHGHECQGPQPLVAHAISQQTPNYAIVRLHHQLAVVISAIICFRQRSVRPLSFFNSSSRRAFFHDLHYPLTPSALSLQQQGDSKSASPCGRFILHCVTDIAQSIPDHTAHAPQQASAWFGRLIDLCEAWKVDTDVVRRHYVCELYSGGHDTLAEEVASSVNNRALLGSQLLLIAGQRIKHRIMGDSDPHVKLAGLPTDLSAWLQTLDVNVLRSRNPPPIETVTLITRVINLIQDNHSDQKLAVALYEVAMEICSNVAS